MFPSPENFGLMFVYLDIVTKYFILGNKNALYPEKVIFLKRPNKKIFKEVKHWHKISYNMS